MRATMRITWQLLLSLGLLFHCVCSETENGGAAVPTKNPDADLVPTKNPGAGLVPTENPGADLVPTKNPGADLVPTKNPDAGLVPTKNPDAGLVPTEKIDAEPVGTGTGGSPTVIGETGADTTGTGKTGGDGTGKKEAGGDGTGTGKTGGDDTEKKEAGGDGTGTGKTGGDDTEKKEAGGDGTGTGKTGGDDTGKKEAGGDGTGTGKTGGDDTGKKEAGSDGTGVTEAGSDGTGKKEAGGDGTGAQTAGGDGTGAQTAGGDSTGTSEPVVDKVPTKEPTIPTLNPKPNARTTAPTAVQLTDKPATAVPTITPRGADPPNTTKLPITPPAVAHPTVVDLSSSGSGASTRPNVFVVSPSVPEIRVTDSSDSKGKPATTMTSSGLTKPGQDTTGSVTHAASSSKDSKGDAVADVTTKTTLAVDPAQATSRTSQPLGGAVTKTAVTGKIVATPGQTATTAPSPTSTSFTTAKKKTFSFSLNEVREKEDEKELAAVCKRLMKDMHAGSCTLTWQQHSDNGKTVFDNVEISGTVKPSLASQYYDELTKKRSDNTTLIAILASCGALLAMIIGLAIYASHHRKPYNENQQHLTEELHTVENGYHDNPTLEVMEVQPEMQEKKMALNGECNDSWIVPIDNLLKEDMADEEDTHL